MFPDPNNPSTDRFQYLETIRAGVVWVWDRDYSLHPAKLHMLSLTHLWVREFWPQIYSLSQALD